MRVIRRLILHHSASPYGCVAVIDDWHKARGFQRCGYHGLILNGYCHAQRTYDAGLDGAIEIGRPWHVIGAHAQGHNRDSLGLCLIGTGPDFSAKQWAALKSMVTMIAAMYPGLQILGHNATKATECPGFDVAAWLQREGL